MMMSTHLLLFFLGMIGSLFLTLVFFTHRISTRRATRSFSPTTRQAAETRAAISAFNKVCDERDVLKAENRRQREQILDLQAQIPTDDYRHARAKLQISEDAR